MEVLRCVAENLPDTNGSTRSHAFTSEPGRSDRRMELAGGAARSDPSPARAPPDASAGDRSAASLPGCASEPRPRLHLPASPRGPLTDAEFDPVRVEHAERRRHHRADTTRSGLAAARGRPRLAGRRDRRPRRRLAVGAADTGPHGGPTWRSPRPGRCCSPATRPIPGGTTAWRRAGSAPTTTRGRGASALRALVAAHPAIRVDVGHEAPGDDAVTAAHSPPPG
jgi:hypothetical protein